MFKKLCFVFLMLVHSVVLADGCDDLIVNFTNQSSQPVTLTSLDSFFDDNSNSFNSFSPTFLDLLVKEVNPGETFSLPRIVNNHRSYLGMRLDLNMTVHNYSTTTYRAKIKKYRSTDYWIAVNSGNIIVRENEDNSESQTDATQNLLDFTLTHEIKDDGNCSAKTPGVVNIFFSEKAVKLTPH